MNEKYCSISQIYILSISMHIQNLIEIHKLIHKILSINKILTSIKGHNSVKDWPTIMCIRYNMGLVYINAYTKLIKIHSFVLKILRKNTFLHQSRAITLLFIKNLTHLQSQTTPPWYQCPCKVWRTSVKKILKIKVRKWSADGRTDGNSNGSESIT